MNLLKCAFLSAAVLCAGTSVALEATGHNDLKGVNAGLEQRMQALRASLTAAFDSLKARVDTFDTRITANRTDIDLIKANGANDEVQRWNPRLETRLDSIETVNANQNTHITNINTVNTQQDVRITNLENRPAGTLALAGEATLGAATGTRTSSAVEADFCVLSQVGFSTTADNHNHACTVNRSGRTHSVTASGVGGQQSCRITCYNLQ